MMYFPPFLSVLTKYNIFTPSVVYRLPWKRFASSFIVITSHIIKILRASSSRLPCHLPAITICSYLVAIRILSLSLSLSLSLARSLVRSLARSLARSCALARSLSLLSRYDADDVDAVASSSYGALGCVFVSVVVVVCCFFSCSLFIV